MIIITLILCTLGLFLASVFSNGLSRGVLMTVFGLGFIASIFFIVQNDYNHFGMKTVTETKTTSLVSTADSQGPSMLLYHPLGNGTEKVYLYRTDIHQSKPKTTQTTKTTNTVKVVRTSPKLVTTTKYRVYKNGQAKFWFGLAGNDHQFVSRHNQFDIGQNWLTLSDVQAKKLAKTLKNQQASLKTAATAYAQKAVLAAMQQTPTMTTAQQQAVAKKAAQQYQRQVIAKAVATLKQ
ncbi:DUF4811 domain-containing protein [Latilactobacillus fuchuensis]|uniref:DUF4811 domain-containing protein n=2 Tax=Latilactobacillus fuchuensis TaxID=164393 RepID=A0A2N9DU00_9LACO|nr:DUF4811 domain-containing protein [Latilactobacillus fuchuensis]KRL61004.1 hypothetical protein FC69_GL001018 [Latilactobacillus fuchuensis DSM 14340 = JCM 11249]SPC37068.1 conserved hypothetical protein [Latilactobacillus fuchuensis]